MHSNNDNILKSCDFVTLDVTDTDTWKNANENETIGELEWFIPNGAYKSVIETPHITTLMFVNGAYRGGGPPQAIFMRYNNGAINHFTQSRKTPVIAYANVRAGNSPVFLSSGEMIVNDRPNFIKVSILDVDGSGILKSEMIGFIFTLKFSYYEKKEI